MSWWRGRRRAAGPAGPGASAEAGRERRVTLYTRAGCHLCEAAAAVLEAERGRSRFALEVVDVDADPELERRYGVRVPVVAIDGMEEFQYEVPADLLRARLGRNGGV
jgi:glutaredoxin